MIRRGPCLVLLALLAGCGGLPGRGYYQDDGPPATVPDGRPGIPDAVPKDEPLSPYGNKTYHIAGHSYTPLKDAVGYRERGVASWYGKKFHGKRTSSGEPYDMHAMTAAHRTLPLPCYARVRNRANGQSVIVRVNDRGPFHDNRLIDLSYTAAARLGVLGTGTGLVEVEAVSPREPAPVQVAGAGAEPRLYLQIGVREPPHAEALRARLEGGDIRQSRSTPPPPQARSISASGLASVEDSDRPARVSASGTGEARVVVGEPLMPLIRSLIR